MYGSHTTVYHSILAMMRDPPVRLGKKTLVEKSSDEFPKFCRSRPIATFVGSSYMILPWIFVFSPLLRWRGPSDGFFPFSTAVKGNKRAAAEAEWQGDGLSLEEDFSHPTTLRPVTGHQALPFSVGCQVEEEKEEGGRETAGRGEVGRTSAVLSVRILGTLLFLFLHP